MQIRVRAPVLSHSRYAHYIYKYMSKMALTIYTVHGSPHMMNNTVESNSPVKMAKKVVEPQFDKKIGSRLILFTYS